MNKIIINYFKNSDSKKIINYSFIVNFIMVIILMTLLISPVFADNVKTAMENDYDFIRRATNPATINKGNFYQAKDEVTAVSFVAFGMIKIYQKVISSQDRSVCNFHPSCSRFAQSAVSKTGLIRGSLMAADRILRCHPYSLDLYHRNKNSQVVSDPVENYMDEN